ncbi:Mov34/MPN/PAD-1 family protein [Kribbella sp. NBC_01245]|uniref:Mov34/MPN/PAD-1 family protein n=1 Tax=Kribbella sp. NBC_01245 TaxID=2903578 RepID=UPI003FA5A665
MLDCMADSGRAALPRETGGILLGYFLDGEPTVTVAPVVPDPRATRIRYRRDARKAARSLRHHLANDKSSLLGYLGEWHTHPVPLGPSGMDRGAIGALAGQGEYDVYLLVLSLGVRGWRSHGLRACADGTVTRINVRIREVET